MKNRSNMQAFKKCKNLKLFFFWVENEDMGGGVFKKNFYSPALK